MNTSYAVTGESHAIPVSRETGHADSQSRCGSLADSKRNSDYHSQLGHATGQADSRFHAPGHSDFASTRYRTI
jgi:hypothetical protein